MCTKRRRIEHALQESEEKYREMSRHDPLTGLNNRMGLQEWVRENMVRTRDKASEMLDAPASGAGSVRSADAIRGAFLYMDLDNFKNINDAYGHNLGDEILVLIGKRLRAFGSEKVMASRIGGDEFVLAVCHERIVETVHELLQNVDATMYKAKALGRDRFVFFSHDMQEELQQRLETLQDLRYARERDEFVLHVQPQFILETGDIAGYEALVRWNHSMRGLMYPGSFIGIAEDGGFIVRIGEAVLEETCRFSNRLRAWKGSPSAWMILGQDIPP